jgi:hypothetical protein
LIISDWLPTKSNFLTPTSRIFCNLFVLQMLSFTVLVSLLLLFFLLAVCNSIAVSSQFYRNFIAVSSPPLEQSLRLRPLVAAAIPSHSKKPPRRVQAGNRGTP